MLRCQDNSAKTTARGRSSRHGICIRCDCKHNTGMWHSNCSRGIILLQLLSDRAPYSEHVVQVDFGDSATDDVKNITPDLQQERNSCCSN